MLHVVEDQHLPCLGAKKRANEPFSELTDRMAPCPFSAHNYGQKKPFASRAEHLTAAGDGAMQLLGRNPIAAKYLAHQLPYTTI